MFSASVVYWKHMLSYWPVRKFKIKDIDLMREIERQASTALSVPSVLTMAKLQRLLKFNSFFHDVIYRSTGSTLLTTMFSNFNNTVYRLRVPTYREVETWNQAWREHSQLVGYLGRRDKERVCRVMQDHISAVGSYVLAGFQVEDYEGAAK